MRRYAVYVRVSTEEQSRPGHVSLETQLNECRRYVLERGGIIALEQDDTQSGLDPNRPGYQKILTTARNREIDAAVVWRFDRWGRDAGEALQSFSTLHRLGIKVESVTEPNNDPFLQGLFSLLGYRESQSISERTAAALRTRAARGEWSGPPPLGYLISREGERTALVPDPETSHHIRALFNEAATGLYSISRLTERVTSAGLRSRRGRSLSRQAVGRMLRNPAYRGAVFFGRRSQSRFRPIGRRPASEWIVVEGAHTPLADATIYAAVQVWLTRHQREQGTIRDSRFLLTSLVYCARCEGTEGRSWRAYGHGTKGAVYQCSRSAMYGRAACGLPSISARGLEAAVRQAVMDNFTLTQELRSRAQHHLLEEAEAARTAAERRRADLERALKRHQEQRIALARRLLGPNGGAIPPDIYKLLEEEEATAVQRIEEELRSLPPEPPVIDTEPLLTALENLQWEDLSWDGWRQILTALVGRINLYDRGHFGIDWEPAAAVLSNVLDRLSRFGSRTFG